MKKKLWIQYSHPDTKDAAVLQTADSEQEAKAEDYLFEGCPWFSYDIDPSDKKDCDGNLVNEQGPIYYETNNKEGRGQ